MNEFLTKDIKISTDSAGYMDSEHKYQGMLNEGGVYSSRQECRKHAVEILKEMKNEAT